MALSHDKEEVKVGEIPILLDAQVPVLEILPTCYQKKAPHVFIQKVDSYIEEYFRVNLRTLEEDQKAVISLLRAKYPDGGQKNC